VAEGAQPVFVLLLSRGPLPLCPLTEPCALATMRQRSGFCGRGGGDSSKQGKAHGVETGQTK
jgi:hypothetical protein